MNIQSASIVIPTHNSCVNKCPFCVSRTHCNLYQNDISKTNEFEAFKKAEEEKDIDLFIDYFIDGLAKEEQAEAKKEEIKKE